MKKLLLALTLIMVLTGCAFLTGKKIITTDAETGKETVTYEDAPIDDWAAILGALIPVGGIALVAAAKITKNAARAKDGLMDANKDAIDNADWKKINTAESFKQLLALAQASHKDAKVIEKEYRKWKKKKA